MDDIIQDAKDKGLITFRRHPTQPTETDNSWWNMRAWVLAHDQDMEAAELSLEEGLRLRKN